MKWLSCGNYLLIAKLYFKSRAATLPLHFLKNSFWNSFSHPLIYWFLQLEFLLHQSRVWHDMDMPEGTPTKSLSEDSWYGFIEEIRQTDTTSSGIQHEMIPGVINIVRAIGCEKRRTSEDWTTWGSLLGGGTLIRNLREEKRRKEDITAGRRLLILPLE